MKEGGCMVQNDQKLPLLTERNRRYGLMIPYGLRLAEEEIPAAQ